MALIQFSALGRIITVEMLNVYLHLFDIFVWSKMSLFYSVKMHILSTAPHFKAFKTK